VLFRSMQTASILAECPICFGPLCNEPCVALATRNQRRACPHFVHQRCTSDLNSKCCPICKVNFDVTVSVPGIDQSPADWFRVVDTNGDGRLTQAEVLEIIKAQLPVDIAMLEGELPGMWCMWDLNHDGTISEQELMNPQSGLIAYVKANIPVRAGIAPLPIPVQVHVQPQPIQPVLPDASAPNPNPLPINPAIAAIASSPNRVYYERDSIKVPDIRSNRNGWFAHFDYDNSHSLDKEEIVRGLVKTLNQSSDAEQVRTVRGVVDAVWPIFDSDGSGSIGKSEFLAPETGLADTIIASMSFP